jgi:transposase InsO family protein
MALCYGVQPKDPLLHSIYNAAIPDPIYQSIVTVIKRGKSVAKLQKGHAGKNYISVWDKISVLDDAILVIDAIQIVVPIKLSHQILQQLHEPHAGINRTRALAQKHYSWPGLSTDIAAMINNCDKCQLLRPSQAAEPLQGQPKPVEPMQSVSMDLYEVRGRHFLVMCDRFSYFCWAAPLNTPKSSTVIRIIDTWFHGVGFPQYIYSDSGPQFNAAEFKNCCEKHFITPLVSSACFPQSNRLAESAVKCLLLKLENYTDFENKLYDLQNTPLSGDTLLPAKKFFKHRFCTHLQPFFNPIMHEEGRKQFKIGDRVRI